MLQVWTKKWLGLHGGTELALNKCNIWNQYPQILLEQHFAWQFTFCFQFVYVGRILILSCVPLCRDETTAEFRQRLKSLLEVMMV